VFYRLQGRKEEACALYGAAFMLCSFPTMFLLLAILSPINPERAPREKLKGWMVTGSEQQAPGCCAEAWGTGSRRLLSSGSGRLGKGFAGMGYARGAGDSQPENPLPAHLHCYSAAAL